MNTKKCNKCGEIKPLVDYYKDKQKADGLRFSCKQCHNKVTAIYAQTDKAKDYRSRYSQALALAVDMKVYPVLTEKTCNKCDNVKPLSEFYRNKRGPDGYRPNCKQCHNKVTTVYMQTDKGKAYRKKYYQANNESLIEYRKQYYQANKQAAVEYQKQYQKERRDTDPLFKLTHNIRVLIRNSFHNGGFNKKSKTAEILGCSFEEFHSHIESQFTDGMSWDLMGDIHIDHRLPLSAANTEEELLVLNHYRNLQPMWATENMAKSDSYCPDELAAYFENHLNQ